jgi:hypothetical protein
MVETLLIETIDLWHMQGPNNKTKAVGDYLRADGPFEGKNNYFDPAI